MERVSTKAIPKLRRNNMIEGITAKDIIMFIVVLSIPSGFGYIAYRIRKFRKKAEERRKIGL